MSAETKIKTIEKLNHHQNRISDQWKDYSKLEIKSVAEGGSYFENIKNLSRWSFQKMINFKNQWIKLNGICLHKR
jgi:endothelin-converting enzyme/putative endopeptidase